MSETTEATPLLDGGDVIAGMLRANGYRPTDRGQAWTREVFSLRSFRTFVVRLERAEEGATLIVRDKADMREIARKTDALVEVAADAIAVAHQLAG